MLTRIIKLIESRLFEHLTKLEDRLIKVEDRIERRLKSINTKVDRIFYAIVTGILNFETKHTYENLQN